MTLLIRRAGPAVALVAVAAILLGGLSAGAAPKQPTLPVPVMKKKPPASAAPSAPAATAAPALPAGPTVIPPLPPHPRLLFNAAGIAEMKKRAESPAWSAAWRSLKSGLDKSLDTPIELPPRGNNWHHWYVCPTHGARLKKGKPIGPYQWEHICPVDKEVLRGDPSSPPKDFDGCCISGIHSGYAAAVRDCGLAYQVTGDARYARRGRDILMAYANKYLDYPLHTIRGEAKIGGGRVGAQTLDESVWLIPVAQGADMLWPALTETERKQLADKLFLPAARDVILPHRLGVHNIQCWKNSAVGLVGFLLDDRELIAAAIDEPKRGYRVQMKEGVQADGSWWEGAWGYHFYTASAVWPLTEAARNSGINLYGDAYKMMFDAPILLAMPNLRLPAFNDSGEVGVSGHADLYELAYARYKNPAYLAILGPGSRRGQMALWYGVDALPPAPPAAGRSHNETASGYAVLQRGQGEPATWLCLKYGPHGGGHGHPDKLNFILYAAGRVVAPDPGTRAYGSPLHAGWDKATVAHNTLVVDETSQAPAEGKCLAFGNAAGADFVMADAGPIYKGVRYVRSAVMLSESLVVFVDQVRADQPHTLDLAYHQRGAWDALPGATPWTPPDKTGYKYMRDCVKLAAAADGAALMTRAEKGGSGVSVTLAGGEPTEVIAGTGIGSSTADRVPMVLFRRQAAATAYVWAVALDGAKVKLDLLKMRGADGRAVAPAEAVAVRVTAGSTVRTILANPDKRSVTVSLPGGENWVSAEPVSVR